MPRLSSMRSLAVVLTLIVGCKSATAVQAASAPVVAPGPHSPIVLFQNADSGMSPTVDFGGVRKIIAVSYTTSRTLTNNNGASVIVETADNANGPWMEIGGFSPGPDSTDAGRYQLSQGPDGFYSLVRGRIVSRFTSGNITVTLYFN